MSQIRKLCSKCGWVGLIGARVRRCKQIDPRDAGFAHQYTCHGRLMRTRVAQPNAVVAQPSKPSLRPQEIAARRLHRAEAKVRDYIEKIRRDALALKAWQRKAERFARLAAQSDAELAVAHEKRSRTSKAVRERRSRRGIDLTRSA